MEKGQLEGALTSLDVLEEGDKAGAIATELWRELDVADDLGFLGKAALIYRLMETKVHPPAEPATTVPLWKTTLLRSTDEQGFPLVIPQSWKEYCGEQLCMHPSTASSHKRIWEVFVVRLNRPLDELLAVGKGKLGAAVGLVAQILPGRNQELEDALFGNPTRCWKCGWVVPDAVQNPPGGCPNCEDPWEPTPPVPFNELVRVTLPNLKAQILGTEKDPVAGRLAVEFELTADKDFLRELAWWVAGDVEYPLPVRLIPIIDDDDAGQVVGLTWGQADEYRSFMAKRFPRGQ